MSDLTVARAARFRALAVTLVALGSLASRALAQQPANPATTNPQHVNYDMPYVPPTPDQVKAVLDRVHARLEAATGKGIINSDTREPITDLSKPDEKAILDNGPEKKISIYSYPTGVIYSGMLLANEVTGDAKYADFVAKRHRYFADNLPALSTWPTDDMRRNPFRNMLAPTSLDACGAMGASIVRAKRMKVNGDGLDDVIERFADYVHTRQFRLSDGTLARKGPFPKSLWLDDAYMSVSLLAQYATLTGKREYFDDAAHQIKSFHKYLYVPAKGFFMHANDADHLDQHPHYFWGRANGWFMVATVELLDLLPEDHSDRPELIKILNQQAKGVASVQSGKGLWHQMLDRPDSYLETSCTAMFAYSMAKGVNRGWLSPELYGPVAIAGWNGVTTKISDDGRVEGTCIGTNYANDFVYYYNRPAMDDHHGYGPVMLCGAEMLRMMKNERLDISGSPTRPVLVRTKGDAK
ncbi:MAG: glycoside hydrolase family 88 protein [Tepidisphaeraceae bacterium]